MAGRSARLAVVGLGYVGIPVAACFAAAGFRVVGFDRNVERVSALRKGELPLAHSEPGLQGLVSAALQSGGLVVTADPAELDGNQVFILAVDTPVDAGHRPDTSSLEAACRTVREHSTPGSLVVVESTLAPRTMRRVVAPLFAGDPTIALAHCPERVRPGRLLANLRGMERLIGVEGAEAGALCVELYATIVRAPLSTTTWETAEVVKTAENSARDVQIALANQLAVICDHVGADVGLVRDHVNRLWDSEPLILEPGPGVGGYCLPKDPWLLASALPADASSALIRGSREMNEAMSAHVVAIVEHALGRAGIDTPAARVGVFGLTYNADSDDTRNAPATRIVDLLKTRTGEIVQHDPFVAPGQGALACFKGLDLALLLIGHAEYRNLDLAAARALMRHAAIVDCRRVVDRALAESLGFAYHGLGLGALA